MLPTNIGESGMVRTSRTQVVGLSEHRSRRRQRLLLARAMQSGDPVRAVLVSHLSELAALTGADRAAAVWIDEYAAGHVHPHVNLDLLNDRPRRSFPLEPLERAWEIGLPGVFEGRGDPFRRFGDGSHIFAVALGSDGARAWFVVCDSIRARTRLSAEERQRVLFLAGECSAALLHQDLDRQVPASTPGRPGRNVPGFVGWQVLEDLEDHGGRDASSRIEQRFMLVRLARSFLDDDYATERDWVDRVDRARSEIAKKTLDGGYSVPTLEPVLDALRAQVHADAADGLVVIGELAEAEGHTHGALEVYRCAFDAAVAVMHPHAAVDAARFQGRVQRRFAQWDESVRAYGVAYEVAVAAELWGLAAEATVGLASVRRETGNLPAARGMYGEALELATRSGNADRIAIVHHGILSVEHVAGNLDLALEHGWRAVAGYSEDRSKMRCLAGLAGALQDFGDRAAAEDAWTVVAERSDETYYRVYARDALAHIAALRGHLAEFQRQARLCDALGWETGPLSAKAEILFYRGKSFRALGLRDAAERWLQRAVDFAEEHGFNRTMFEAEAELRLLKEREEAAAPPVETTPAAPPEVREGLREMRRELAVAGNS